MPLIYVTGMPGSGKSSVRQELLIRGISAYGGAEDGIARFYTKAGERLAGWAPANARTPEWRRNHAWNVSREDALKLKAEAQNKPVYLCAVADNEAELWDIIDKVIVLTIDEETMKRRLAARTNNDVGKAQGEISEILMKTEMREAAYPQHVIRIDATQPLEAVVEAILAVSK